MALKLNEKYPGRANPPSIDYPQGSIKNESAPDANDGTPLDQDWANDKEGFFQKLLSYRGVSANGNPDNAVTSQYFDAIFADPTEALRGLPTVATDAEARAMTNNTKMLSAQKLAAAFAGTNQSLSPNGFQRLPGGLLLQWVNVVTPVVPNTSQAFVWPIAFSSNAAVAFAPNFTSGSGAFIVLSVAFRTNAGASLYCSHANGTLGAVSSTTIIGIGY